MTDLDNGEPIEKPGQQLIDPGLTLAIPEKPGAVVVTYEKIVR